MPELGTYLVTIVLRAQEEISGAVRRAVGSLNDLNKTAGKASTILGDLGRIAAGVVAGFIGFNILRDVKRWIEEGVERFAKFEAASIRLASLARETGQSVEGLAAGFRVVASAAARELAVSGQDAITALEGLVKAGLSGRDAALALKDAIMLARIEGVDFATASANLVQVMAQFGVAGGEARRVVDALINASRLGIGTANDFAQGLANCGATARAMGLSLEEAAAWLVVLERRFGSAQEAGTHLNRFLLELYEIAGKLGVPIYDLNGNLRSTNEIMLEVINTVKNSGMSFADLQKRLEGVDMRALKALMTFTQMSESIEELTAEISRSGAAWNTYVKFLETTHCLLYTSPSPRDGLLSRMPSSA